MDSCICMAESLLCSPETITVFLIGYLSVLVARSRPTLCDPMDCSPPGFSVHGILQYKIKSSKEKKMNDLSSSPGDREEQGSLAPCSPWGHKQSDTTEQLNNENSFSSQLLHIIPLNSSSPGRKVSILQRGWEVLVAVYLFQTQDMGSSPLVYTVTSGHCELRH